MKHDNALDEERARTGRHANHVLGIVAAIGASIAWGIGIPISKGALDHAGVTEIPLVTFEVSGAVVVFLLICVLTRGLPRQVGVKWRIGWPGILEPGVAFTVGVIGLAHTSASHGAVLVALEAPLAALGAWLLLRERMERGALICSAGALVGVVVVAFDAQGGGGATLGGDGIFLIGIVAAAAYVIASSRVGRDAPTLTVAATQQVAALTVIAPVVLLFIALGNTFTLPQGLTGWALVLGSSFANVIAPYAMYLVALRHIPAAVAAQFLSIIPIVGLATSAIFLDDPLTPGMIIGGAIVAIALFGLGRRSAPSPHPAPSVDCAA
jgi:drug/metabolite transporter (DMT)-like permease